MFGEVCQFTPYQMLWIKNFGRRTLNELERILFDCGLSLAGYTPEQRRLRMEVLGLSVDLADQPPSLTLTDSTPVAELQPFVSPRLFHGLKIFPAKTIGELCLYARSDLSGSYYFGDILPYAVEMALDELEIVLAQQGRFLKGRSGIEALRQFLEQKRGYIPEKLERLIPYSPASAPASSDGDVSTDVDLLARYFSPSLPDDTPIDELEISVRLYNGLKNSSLGTIGEICQLNRGELLRRKYLGRKPLNELEIFLAQHGRFLQGRNGIEDLKQFLEQQRGYTPEQLEDLFPDAEPAQPSLAQSDLPTQHSSPYLSDDESVDALDYLSVRPYNGLKNSGFDTIGEVCKRTRPELDRIKNFGGKSLDELEIALAQNGRFLKGRSGIEDLKQFLEQRRGYTPEQLEELFPNESPSAAQPLEQPTPPPVAETAAEIRVWTLLGEVAAEAAKAGVDPITAEQTLRRQAADDFSPDEMAALNSALKSSPFKEIAHVEGAKRVSEVQEVAETVFAGKVMTLVNPNRTERRRAVTLRLLYDMFFARTRQHYENPPPEGQRSVFSDLKAKAAPDAPLGEWFQKIHDFFYRALPDVLDIRGFRVRNGVENMTWAQRVGIAQALTTLEDDRERSAIFTAEARSRKTIMALLAAFNIKAGGSPAVTRVLYTTRRAALHEVAKEINMRMKLDKPTTVIVLDGTREQRKRALDHAKTLPGNVILVANYDAAAQFGREIEKNFKPDCQIIDESENIKGGSERVIARQIFDIYTPYRIAISARLVPTRKEDAAPVLAWARARSLAADPRLKLDSTPEEYNEVRKLVEHRLRQDDIGLADMFEFLEPVSVRMKRSVILPELGEPVRTLVPIDCDLAQMALIRDMRKNMAHWQNSGKVQHTFARMRFILEAATDLELAKERLRKVNGNDDYFNAVVGSSSSDLLDVSPKIKALDKIIEETLHPDQPNALPGKIIIVAESVAELERLVKRYNEKYKELYAKGPAVSITGDTVNAAQIIENFKGNPAGPWILFSTERQVGDSLNLSPYPGSSFAIKKVVRLMPSVSINSALGERLLDPVQGTQMPEEINLVATFPKGPEDALQTLYYLQNAKGNKNFIKGRLRFVNLKSNTINMVLNQCLTQPPQSLADLETYLSSEEIEKVIEALRPKTVDEMILMANVAKAKLRNAIIDGHIAKDEEAESDALSLENQIKTVFEIELASHAEVPAHPSTVTTLDVASPFVAEQESEDREEEKQTDRKTSWQDTQLADSALQSIAKENNPDVTVMFASKKNMFTDGSMKASARDKAFFDVLNKSLSIKAKLAVYFLIHGDMPEDLDDISDQDWNHFVRFESEYLRRMSRVVDGKKEAKIAFSRSGYIRLVTALRLALEQNYPLDADPQRVQLTNAVLEFMDEAIKSIQEFYNSDSNAIQKQQFEIAADTQEKAQAATKAAPAAAIQSTIAEQTQTIVPVETEAERERREMDTRATAHLRKVTTDERVQERLRSLVAPRIFQRIVRQVEEEGLGGLEELVEVLNDVPNRTTLVERIRKEFGGKEADLPLREAS